MRPLPPDLEAHLLGREVRDVLVPDDRQAISGRRVLVTGGGGSVGSELARQLAACRPAVLALVDHSEYALFRIASELRRLHPWLRIEAVLGDVSRTPDVRSIVREVRPHVVYHAAAYKHVAMTEGCIVPATRTNVLGSIAVATAARACGARFVLVSSDKAAQPTSVMGATKRMAELAVLALADRGFRPVVVRFGNILGSSGSVVEIMLESLERGQPIPITDPDATRFFMTAREAVGLVIKAELLGLRTDVFWLDMGAAVRIGDLASRLMGWAESHGLAPVALQVIGLRPGEKVREELTTQALAMTPTRHARIWSARQRTLPRETVDAAVRELRRGCARGDAGLALAALAHAVTDFTPSSLACLTGNAAAPARAASSVARHVRRSA